MLAPFLETDIEPFLALAETEGWICGRWEFEFLLRSFPQGCFVWREKGRTLGYITSVKYGKSGWIGNLLVHPDARKRGLGRGLMESTISELLKSGVETVWLTASAQGAGLYQKLGFFTIDSVNRWTGKGEAGSGVQPVPLDLESIQAVDRVGWGERRDSLLRLTCDRGRLYGSSGGFLCCQAWEDGTQIGPWGCLIGAQAEQLLEQALSGAGRRVFLDVPAGNHAAAALLNRHGFAIKGSSLLMYLGAEPLYQPSKVFALASMGSMG
jgi:ribosomal protein S18 acetylase RimI-like enzyme